MKKITAKALQGELADVTTLSELYKFVSKLVEYLVQIEEKQP